jgi:hypothetical protein
MKTVLAPNAPWPNKVEPTPQPVKRKPRQKITSSKVDQNFDRWLSNISASKGNNNA